MATSQDTQQVTALPKQGRNPPVLCPCRAAGPPTAPNPGKRQAMAALRGSRHRSSVRPELQRYPVDAVALSGRRRSIVKDVAEMPAAVPAVNLCTRHEERAVSRGADSTRDCLPEAGPACSAIELGRRGIHRQVASSAHESAGTLLLVERARAGPLGAVPPQHAVLSGREDSPPFFVSAHDFKFPARSVRSDHGRSGGRCQ